MFEVAETTSIHYTRPVPDFRPVRWVLWGALLWGIGSSLFHGSGSLLWFIEQFSLEALQNTRIRRQFTQAALVVAVTPLFTMAILACLARGYSALRKGEVGAPGPRVLIILASAAMVAATLYPPAWWLSFRPYLGGTWAELLTRLNVEAQELARWSLVPTIVLVAGLRGIVSWRFAAFAALAQALVLTWLTSMRSILLLFLYPGAEIHWIDHAQFAIVTLSTFALFACILAWSRGALAPWAMRIAALCVVLGHVVPSFAIEWIDVYDDRMVATVGAGKWLVWISGYFIAVTSLLIAMTFWPSNTVLQDRQSLLS